MDSKFLKAEEFGIRLEIVQGLPIWEPYPIYKHQKAVDRIRATIVPLEPASEKEGRGSCVHTSDVYVSFPDGSLKRPDISIFCREPAEEEEAIKLVPEAVVEVISKGYEAKDIEIGPQFYLSQGVKDVVVFNPYTLLVLMKFRGMYHLLSFICYVAVAVKCSCLFSSTASLTTH